MTPPPAQGFDDIGALVARHLTGYEVRSVARLGSGMDNVVFEVNGELVVRTSRDPRSDQTRREAELLAVLPEFSTLPTPKLVFADVEAGALAYGRLPGRPLTERPPVDPMGLAATLGEFVSRLHQAPAERMEWIVPREDEPLIGWRNDAERDYRQIVDLVPPAARAAVEDFLGHVVPAQPTVSVFCHNDLGTEHVLVADATSEPTGIIDWSDAAITDPVHDLSRLYRDLGPEFFDQMLSWYDGPRDDADRERAVFYARCELLEDIAYGVRSGAAHYTQAGLAHLAWTFA